MLKSIINPDSAGKKTFPKTLTLMFTLILLATLPLLANNVSIDGAVTIANIDVGLDNADIQFDISWENSWRTNDLDGDSLTWGAENLPAGATFTDHHDGDATFEWTPDFTQSGEYLDVLFIVTDEAGAASTYLIDFGSN